MDLDSALAPVLAAVRDSLARLACELQHDRPDLAAEVRVRYEHLANLDPVREAALESEAA